MANIPLDPRIKEREHNLELLGDYVTEGTPLDQKKFLELMDEPEVVMSEIRGDGAIAKTIAEKILSSNGDIDEMRRRYDRVLSIAKKALELGHGEEGFKGRTTNFASPGSYTGNAVIKRSRGHRRRTTSTFIARQQR